ncbi:hypothetical protein B566_EDAN007723 [Ephemera danica]|nr:hypothetical protein B566_EDAN007723 [Ephemera danica]
MSLYPSLEDMKMDEMEQAQLRHEASQIEVAQDAAQSDSSLPYPVAPSSGSLSIYPALGDFMGYEITQEMVTTYAPQEQQQALVHASTVPSGPSNMLTLCKDQDGKIGLRLRAVNHGLFVCLVTKGSPAALAGLRFGDQILQINGQDMAGMSMEQGHKILKNCPTNNIKRTVVLHKDSSNHIGFQFKQGRIVGLVKDSSAARNGLLTDHQILEINGQNVVGLKDKELAAIIESSQQVVTLTVMPYCLYEHMVNKMAGSLLSSIMDHSLPTF